MQVCDFARSYMFFEVDHERATTVTARQPIAHNLVRIPLECLCEVTTPDGVTQQYVLTASCKTEKVAVDADIWMQPNADFCVVSSEDEFLILKRWQQCGLQIERESSELAAHQERQVGRCAEAWTSHQRDVCRSDARELLSNDEIIGCVLNKQSLVSRTEFQTEGGFRFVLEYPVKTINVSDRAGNYQVDTGPVLFPDFSVGHERLIGNFRLAFVAHHQPTWSEFILNVPTPVGGGVEVPHYSRPVRLETSNSMYTIEQPSRP